ncbi:hypothetical protein Avbf_11492 [Armadillidium vulgare]|nr:hypothetical protein Avbf_11492 [Armadillidium vulgare]
MRINFTVSIIIIDAENGSINHTLSNHHLISITSNPVLHIQETIEEKLRIATTRKCFWCFRQKSGGCPPIESPTMESSIRICPDVAYPDCPDFEICEENQICCANGCRNTCYDPILKRFFVSLSVIKCIVLFESRKIKNLRVIIKPFGQLKIVRVRRVKIGEEIILTKALLGGINMKKICSVF